MTDIRAGAPADLPALEGLYPAAFPKENLLPLVRALLEEGRAVVSLVAEARGAVAAHALVALCDLDGSSGAAALLGPLAVAPDRQRQGLGRALIAAARERAAEAGAARLCVLGDPAYYGPLGFEPETGIAPPYPLPEAWREAWRSVALADGPAPQGTLRPPAPWRDPALWAP